MSTTLDTRQPIRITVASALLLAAGALHAQANGLSRTIVGRADVSVPGREAIVARVEIAAGARAARHTHPGDEISYVAEGEVELIVDGQAPRIVKAGESFVIPAGTVHEAHNPGAVPVKLVDVYVLEKGKPLATPAP